ncbi:MAG TPA: hypothetical protein VJA16_00680 [Thermoanaerobaculia bacterium]
MRQSCLSQSPATGEVLGRGPRCAVAAGLALLYALLSVGAGAWRSTPIDDAFIDFRYAANLAAGNGLIWNPPRQHPGGEAVESVGSVERVERGERVEGYSSLSWVLLLAAGRRLGADLPLFAKSLGILLGAATVCLLAGVKPGGLWAAAWFAVFLPGLYHFVNGLETGWMTLLVTAIACLPHRLRWQRGLRHGVAALLSLTRPEGLVVVLLWNGSAALAERWTAARGRDRQGAGEPFAARERWLSVMVAAAAFALQLGFRLAYYGDWIANSARAKMLSPAAALPRGLYDLEWFCREGGALGLLPLLALAAAASSRPSTISRLLFLVALAPVVALGGGDVFPLWRYDVPLAPLLLLSAAAGAAEIAARLARSSLASPGVTGTASRRARWALAAIGAAVLLALLVPYGTYQEEMARFSSDVADLSALGRRFARLYPPTATIAVCAAGALPYYSGLETIDMLGLNDRHIARVRPDLRYDHPGHQRHDGAYVLSRRPDVLVLANAPLAATPDAPFPWQRIRLYESDLVADARFAADYVLDHIPVAHGRYAEVFIRRAGGRLAAGARGSATRDRESRPR